MVRRTECWYDRGPYEDLPIAAKLDYNTTVATSRVLGQQPRTGRGEGSLRAISRKYFFCHFLMHGMAGAEVSFDLNLLWIPIIPGCYGVTGLWRFSGSIEKRRSIDLKTNLPPLPSSLQSSTV